jgi:hypothetical protein
VHFNAYSSQAGKSGPEGATISGKRCLTRSRYFGLKSRANTLMALTTSRKLR